MKYRAYPVKRCIECYMCVRKHLSDDFICAETNTILEDCYNPPPEFCTLQKLEFKEIT